MMSEPRTEPPVPFELSSGQQVHFPAPGAGDAQHETVFVLGVRKSGSTLFNRLTASMAHRYGLPHVDIGGGFFSQDVKASQWIDDPRVGSLFRRGAMHGGFRVAYRHFQDSEIYREARKLLLVRDPRDALVSQYFSTRKTHSLPRNRQGAGGAAEQLLAQRQAAEELSQIGRAHV